MWGNDRSATNLMFRRASTCSQEVLQLLEGFQLFPFAILNHWKHAIAAEISVPSQKAFTCRSDPMTLHRRHGTECGCRRVGLQDFPSNFEIEERKLYFLQFLHCVICIC